MRKDKHSKQIEQICRQILAYLREHPQARDTLEGIVHWWMLEQTISQQSAIIKRAVNILVENDFLVKEKKMDKRFHYRINPLKRRVIENIINDPGQ